MASRDAVGRAVYETEVDPSGLKKGLSEAERSFKTTGAAAERAFGTQATGAMSKFSGGITGLVGKFNQIAKGGGIGGALLGGVGLGAGLSAFNMVQGAITGALDKVGKGIQLASDKAEAASKAQVLFGDSYGIIEKASKSAATSVGLSSGAYLEAAGNLGNLITNFGITGDAGAEMSRSMVQLAADMGSFNNASTAEVTEAMGSAFVGETEPIRRFGVMLSAASIAAKAVELGLAKSTKEVSQSAKVQATYQLILEQTTKAQGDFARTADGMANSQRIAAARQEEALTRLGEAITPLAMELMPLLAEAATGVVEALTAIIGVAKDVGGVLRDLNELWKPWEKEARLAREEAERWTDELAKMPGAAGLSREFLLSIARGAVEAGAGLAGATEDLKDFIRWTQAIEGGGSQLAGMVRNFERWSEWAENAKNGTKGLTLTTEQFDRKVRAMVHGGLAELVENLDILPPRLAAVVEEIASGDDAVTRFVDSWTEMGRQLTHGEITQGQWSQFLISNTELVREHFEQLPEHIQDAMIAGGIVVRQELGDWGGTIAQVYQARLVNSMQGFWTGAGANALTPPDTVRSAVRDAVARIGDLFDLDFSGAATMGPRVQHGVDAAVAAIGHLGPGFRAELKETRKAAEDGMDEILDALKNPTKFNSTIRKVEDNLDRLYRMRARAARQGNEVEVAIIDNGIQLQVGLWQGATGQSYQYGQRITQRHGKGMRDGIPYVSDAAEASARAAGKPLKALPDKAYSYGERTTSAYAAGIAAGRAAAVEAGRGVVHAVGNVFKASSPPTSPLNPMRDITRWGRRTMEAYGDGMRQGLPLVAGVLGGLGGPSLAGWSISASATQSVRHEHGGRVEVALSGSTIQAAREQGATWDDLGRMAAAANLSDVLRAADRSAGARYSGPR